METTTSKIHRGKVLHAVAARHVNTIVQIAKDAGYEQSTFYVHVKKSDLSLEILYKYSKAINYDFTSDFPEMNDFLKINGLKKSNDEMLSYDELLNDRDNWRDKYYALLEENSRLIKEKYNQI